MITKFIEMYIAAFLSQDAAYISSIYSYPVIFYAEAGDVVVLNEDQFSENTGKLFGVYEALGVSKIGYEIVSQNKLSDSFTLVSIKWQFQDKAGNEIYSCTTRYVYRLIGKAIKISAVFVVDETSRFSDLRNEGKI